MNVFYTKLFINIWKFKLSLQASTKILGDCWNIIKIYRTFWIIDCKIGGLSALKNVINFVLEL